jgi:Endonuclease-reverse transcriptase
VRLSLGAAHFTILLVYRPGSEEASSLFFDELSSVLEMLVVLACPVLIGGDFNVKVQLADDSSVRRMRELLTCFDMVQHPNGPTHNRGNTLDLVIIPSSSPLDSVDVEPAGRYSDHSLVVCSFPLVVESPPVSGRLVYGWRRVDRKAVQRMLDDNELSRPQPDDVDVDQLFLTYETVLHNVADRLAPPIVVRRKPNCTAP